MKTALALFLAVAVVILIGYIGLPFAHATTVEEAMLREELREVRNVICRRGWQRAIRAAPRMIFIV